MENEIIYAIASAIGEVFPLYPVYMEEVRQGFSRPAFFIKANEPHKIPALSFRSKFCVNMEVQFFPENENKNHTINDIAKSIAKILEYLDIEGVLLHGTNIYWAKKSGVGVSGFDTQYESMEGVLSVYADYTYKVKEEEADGDGMMEKLIREGGLK